MNTTKKLLADYELFYLRNFCDITKQSVEQGFTLYERFIPLECGIEAYSQFTPDNKKRLVLRYSLDKHNKQLFMDSLIVAKAFYGDLKHKLSLDNPVKGEFYKYEFIEV